MPGIGTNMLADRLKRLESEGLVTKHSLPEPAHSVIMYELTPAGMELEPVLRQLVRWSWRHVGPGPEEAHDDSRWMALALRAQFAPELARDVEACYELDLPKGKVWARVSSGSVSTGTGPAENPDVVIRSDVRTLRRVGRGALPWEDALRDGSFVIEGAPDAVQTMMMVFSRA